MLMIFAVSGLICFWSSFAFAQSCPQTNFKNPRYLEAHPAPTFDNPDCHSLNRLKHIPLDQEDSLFITLGGEIRERYEFTHNPLFGEGPQDKNGVFLQRYSLLVDLQFREQFRAFSQLISALENGRRAGPSPVDEDRLAVQNLFADLYFPVANQIRLTLRGGRQEIKLGSGRLLDTREGPNVRRTFDGGRLILEMPVWTLSAIAARLRKDQPGIFDDGPNEDVYGWSFYAVGKPHLLSGMVLDLYYIGFRDERGRFQQGTADEKRHTIGTRLSGETHQWDYNWELVYQFGTFGSGDIQAWSLATDTGFTWKNAGWKPRLALNANIASGDKDPNDNDLETFNALFPRGNYFSQAAVLGPRNFFNIHPFLTFHPARDWSITTDLNFFWRLETSDGIYSPSGQLIRPSSDSDERFVASAVSVNAEWNITHHLLFTAIYTHLFPGDFIQETGSDDSIDFIELTLQFIF